MTCTNPVRLKQKKGQLYVPCGKCVSCRIHRAREWATRIMHEVEYNPRGSCFVTLTYDDESLPENKSLEKKELQRFFNSLRKRIGRDCVSKNEKKYLIKYYGCGEYGEKKGRPHYHAIIFNMPPDKETKETVQDVWNKGRTHVGTVTYDSARYVADYVGKKFTGELAKETYGENEPPFQLQSQGLGKRFAEENAEYLRSKLGCTIRGVEVGMPRYYAKKLEITGEDFEKQAKEANRKVAEHHQKKTGRPHLDAGLYDKPSVMESLEQADKNIKARNALKRKGNL